MVSQNDIVDGNGLNKDNTYLVVFIPPTQNALVFRVKGRANARNTIIDYGLIDTTTSTSNSNYTTTGVTTGGSTTSPAAGTIAANSFTPNLQFDNTNTLFNNAYDKTDLWYYPEDYRERLFDIVTMTTPQYLRITVNIPTNVVQQGFQRNRIAGGADKDLGYRRGKYQVIQFPRLHYGWVFGNDTNMIPYVRIKFAYAEYFVEIPDNPMTIFNILNRQIPARWQDLPIVQYDPTIRDSFIKAYGFEGFPIYPLDEQRTAIAEYTSLISQALI